MGYQPIFVRSGKIGWARLTEITVNEDSLQLKKTSKYKKGNISATTDWIFLKFETLALGEQMEIYNC
jgi:hypothetical protein